ncbi:hypothetical protein ACFVP3_35685 [Streptomyces sp. NPDC057806]
MDLVRYAGCMCTRSC